LHSLLLTSYGFSEFDTKAAQFATVAFWRPKAVSPQQAGLKPLGVAGNPRVQ